MSGRRNFARILVVDDDLNIRMAVARLVKLHFGAAVVGQAADAQSALQIIAVDRWDLVLLDISMPGMSGLDALREMRSRQELVPVAIMSALPAAQYEAASRAAGAFAYVQKERLANELVAVVRSSVSELVLAGQR